jgi:ribonuclease P protein component
MPQRALIKGFSAASEDAEAQSKAPRHETHLPALQDPPCAQPRLSRPHEHGRRPQGSRLAPRQGARPAHAGLIARHPGHRWPAQTHRLRGARAFEAVFRAGRRLDGQYLQLVAAPAAAAPGRIGYIIPRRAIRLAVDRNRLRRRLREAVRAARPAADRYDMILRVRAPVARSLIPAAAAEAVALLARLVGE